jgi:hypothetical protein
VGNALPFEKEKNPATKKIKEKSKSKSLGFEGRRVLFWGKLAGK